MPKLNAKPHKDYSATPLPRKLSILTAKGALNSIALIGAPQGFRAMLGELPTSTQFTTRITTATQIGICFVRSPVELAAMLDLLPTQLPAGIHFWIANPKAQHKPGFNSEHVRLQGLAHGYVDYKICSIDADWSGTKFAPRKL